MQRLPLGFLRHRFVKLPLSQRPAALYHSRSPWRKVYVLQHQNKQISDIKCAPGLLCQGACLRPTRRFPAEALSHNAWFHEPAEKWKDKQRNNFIIKSCERIRQGLENKENEKEEQQNIEKPTSIQKQQSIRQQRQHFWSAVAAKFECKCNCWEAKPLREYQDYNERIAG